MGKCNHDPFLQVIDFEEGWYVLCEECGLAGKVKPTEAEARFDFRMRDNAPEMKALLDELAHRPSIQAQLNGDGAVLAMKARALLAELKGKDDE